MFLWNIETLHEIILLISTTSNEHLPSVLWRCWLGGRKGIRPVKKLSGGVLAWLSVYKMWHIWGQCFYDADDHSRQNAFNEMSNAISNMLKMLKICYQFGEGLCPPGPSAEPPLWLDSAAAAETVDRGAHGTKVCRYNWHSAGFRGCWRSPMLKSKYIFHIKYTEAISSNSTRKLVTVWKNKFIVCVIYYDIIFGTLSFPIAAAGHFRTPTPSLERGNLSFRRRIEAVHFMQVNGNFRMKN